MPRLKAAMLGVGIVLASLAAGASRAEDYPSRPIRVVVGFGPGAVADVILRVMAARMSQSLGQQLVVENRPGAGSSLGAEYVSRAPKDGYTLLMCTVAQTINPAMNNLSFDFGKDFAPIALVANAPQMLVAHPSLPANSIRELIALAKSQPDGVQYASSGAGTMSHLSGVLLNSAAGIKLQQIPYPGSAQSMTDVLAGRVPLMFGPAATVWANVQAGKLKALAVTQPKRAAIAPDVPTMIEAGVPGYSAGIWMGLLAPAGTPPEIVDKLSRAANEALKSKEVLSLMETQGVDPLGGTPAEFARFIDDELKKWDGVVKAAGIKPLDKSDRAGIRHERIGIGAADRGRRGDGCVSATTAACGAGDFPTRPIRLMVGFPAGSVADISARVLANRMSQILGQQVVVENKPGAASSIAADFVAHAPKDGYTMFQAGLREHHQCGDQSEAAVRHRQGFRADRAGQRGHGHPGGALRRSASTACKELIALAKSKPGEIDLRLDRRRHAPHSGRRVAACSDRDSSSCTCPIRAARRRRPTCSPAASR